MVGSFSSRVVRSSVVRSSDVRARFLSPALALLLLASVGSPGVAQDPAQPQDLGFPDLVAGLRAVEGNLGVETARTQTGKNVIFAWFEDKAAVLRWYHSEIHRDVQNRFFPDRPPHTPLAHVPDDVGPVLAVAAITFADRPRFEGTPLPISQISIELYAPLPGGLALGGTFAPAGLKVPHMMRYDEGVAAEER